MKKSKKETENRILTFTRKKGEEKSVSASEVARDLFSGVWEDHLDEVRNKGLELRVKGKASVLEKEEPVNIDKGKGPIRLSLLNDK